MNWNILQSEKQLNKIIERSKEVPCLIFKHSTSCPISSMAKSRLEMAWNINGETVEPYYLDLIAYRAISNKIASDFGIRHESPQVLLIKDGVCSFTTSHLDISVDGVKENLEI